MNERLPPIRAIVADDEPAAREVVITLLADYPAIQVVGEAGNGHETVRLVRDNKPDLLFLDIIMPDLDGFGVLQALGADVPRGVVFVTAHDEHAIRAFEVHALDYLLKPFGRPRFNATVNLALERLRAQDALTLGSTLASMAADREASQEPPAELSMTDADVADRTSARPRRVGVRTGTRTMLLDVDSIDWVEAVGDYARLHVGKRSYLVLQRMHVLDSVLYPEDYVRIHRSTIVRLTRIRELRRESDGGGTLVLDTGVRLRVARGRWEALTRALQLREL